MTVSSADFEISMDARILPSKVFTLIQSKVRTRHHMAGSGGAPPDGRRAPMDNRFLAMIRRAHTTPTASTTRKASGPCCI
jgi:hypothetical protein